MLIVTLQVGIALAMTLSAVIADLARPGDDEYVIWPKTSISVAAVDFITVSVTDKAGGASEVYVSRISPGPIPLYWLARLPASDVEKIRSIPGVKNIELNKVVAKDFYSNSLSNTNTTFSNFEKFATQTLPATELRVISQPSGSAKIDRYRNYVYRTDKRTDAYIYHAELGINDDHDDFKGVLIEWIWTDLQIVTGGKTETEAASMWNGHSTCTASKAAGRIYGSAKQERLVVVKMLDYSIASIAEIMWKIYSHVRINKRNNRSVVTVSWGSIDPVAFPLDPQDDLWLSVYEAMAGLHSLGVVIVCAAGNDALELNAAGRPRTLVDTAPAVFNLYAKYPAIVVVGNCDNYGRRHSTSQRTGRQDFPQIHAPGVDIQCASASSSSAPRLDTGTSFSAPLVAGVLAELIAVGEIPASSEPEFMYHFLTTRAGWKRPEGEYVVWDLVPPAINPPSRFLVNASLFNSIANSSGIRLTE